MHERETESETGPPTGSFYCNSPSLTARCTHCTGAHVPGVCMGESLNPNFHVGQLCRASHLTLHHSLDFNFSISVVLLMRLLEHFEKMRKGRKRGGWDRC